MFVPNKPVTLSWSVSCAQSAEIVNQTTMDAKDVLPLPIDPLKRTNRGSITVRPATPTRYGLLARNKWGETGPVSVSLLPKRGMGRVHFWKGLIEAFSKAGYKEKKDGYEVKVRYRIKPGTEVRYGTRYLGGKKAENHVEGKLTVKGSGEGELYYVLKKTKPGKWKLWVEAVAMNRATPKPQVEKRETASVEFYVQNSGKLPEIVIKDYFPEFIHYPYDKVTLVVLYRNANRLEWRNQSPDSSGKGCYGGLTKVKEVKPSAEWAETTIVLDEYCEGPFSVAALRTIGDKVFSAHDKVTLIFAKEKAKAPKVVKFEAHPREVEEGHVVDLSIEVANIDRPPVLRWKNAKGCFRRWINVRPVKFYLGGDRSTKPVEVNIATYSIAPRLPGRYCLYVYNGSQYVKKCLDIKVKGMPTPKIHYFQVTPLEIHRGDTVTFRYKFENASRAEIVDMWGERKIYTIACRMNGVTEGQISLKLRGLVYGWFLKCKLNVENRYGADTREIRLSLMDSSGVERGSGTMAGPKWPPKAQVHYFLVHPHKKGRVVTIAYSFEGMKNAIVTYGHRVVKNIDCADGGKITGSFDHEYPGTSYKDYSLLVWWREQGKLKSKRIPLKIEMHPRGSGL